MTRNNKNEFDNITKSELKFYKRLNTPTKIQDFLDRLGQNFETRGDTCYSPRMVLKRGTAQCMEGAMLAAAALRFHGYKPLIVDLESTSDDLDHVIAVFQKNGYWGAISKTNHVVLRYREPVYKTIRELVMSYFHEYFLNKNGKKTLRSYSRPINLSRFDKLGWMTSSDVVWYIPDYLTTVAHTKILTRRQIAGLRRADKIEITAGKLVANKKR